MKVIVNTRENILKERQAEMIKLEELANDKKEEYQRQDS